MEGCAFKQPHGGKSEKEKDVDPSVFNLFNRIFLFRLIDFQAYFQPLLEHF